MILNDSSLFSNNADITTKEILKRYGDRARAPVVNSPSNNASAQLQHGTTSPSPVPVATHVEADREWGNESSVRHVVGGSEMGAPRASGESMGMREGGRAVAV